jgi:hypothetical protein
MVRENAMRRVETTFRWSKTIEMVITAYEKAIDLAANLQQYETERKSKMEKQFALSSSALDLSEED